ncbi:MAG: hypothetical protein Q9167_001320 [Letrouitia subvulpina]
MAGYRFLMRYYGVGDLIYIFGFSRGAFTARFLARMISHVGLLSMGNEEMVPFAYKVYQDYEMGVANAGPYMETFRSTFCRHEVDESSKSKGPDVGIKVHFLGLFDTVNSVGTFDVPFTATPKIPNVNGTAEHVRHAVAIDERRVKFKAALLAQDRMSERAPSENHKEVWFPGSHCDIGGGWPAENERPKEPLSWWQRFKRLLFRAKARNEASLDKSSDWFQLSDIPLKWMIDELDNLRTDRLHWNEENKQDFLARFARSRSKAIKARMHDSMAFGGGSSFGKTMMWKLMEWLPFIKRWEYYPKTGWRYVRLPLNKGATRDIPPGALLHHSVIERLQYFSDSYRPRNDVSVHAHLCHLSDAVPHVIEYGDTPPKKGPFFMHHDQQDDDKETDLLQFRRAASVLSSNDPLDSEVLELPSNRQIGYSICGPSAANEFVFFLHGHPGSRLEGLALSNLAHTFNCKIITPERPGIGLSTPIPGRQALDHPAQISTLANRLGITNYRILAASGGAPYAFACAKASPKKEVKSIGFLAGIGPSERAFRGVRWGNYWGATVAYYAPNTSRRLLDRSIVRRAQDEDPEVYRRYIAKQNKRAKADERAYIETHPEERDQNIEITRPHFIQGPLAFLKEISLQTLPIDVTKHAIEMQSFKIWYGSKMNSAIKRVDLLAKGLKNTTVRVFDGEDHLTLLSNRGEEIIEDLLKD